MYSVVWDCYERDKKAFDDFYKALRDLGYEFDFEIMGDYRITSNETGECYDVYELKITSAKYAFDYLDRLYYVGDSFLVTSEVYKNATYYSGCRSGWSQYNKEANPDEN